MRLAAVVVLLVLGVLTQVRAGAVDVVGVRSFERARMVFADARFSVKFSPAMVEALEAGVALKLDYDVELTRPSRFWFDDVIARVRHSYLIERFALAERFLVTDRTRSDQWTFKDIAEVETFLSHPPQMPFAEHNLLVREGEPLLGRVRVRLDKESLPAPLRPVAYLSPSWWLGSDWLEWQLGPEGDIDP